MGKISKGILGPISGEVGTVVGGTWKGIPYLRSKANRTHRAATQKQEIQRLRFGVSMAFIRPLSSLVEVTFGRAARGMTGMNSAVSYVLKNAITGTYPDFAVDYSLALVSRGELPNGAAPKATLSAANLLQFTWTSNTGTGKAADDDLCVLVAYCPAKKQANTVLNGPVRSSGAGQLDVSNFKGEDVHAWIAFISADGKEISDSMYLGVYHSATTGARIKTTAAKKKKK